MSIILLLFIFFVFYLLQVILFNRYWNEDLQVNIKFKHSEIFEGETTELIEEIRNSKFMPVWWLGIQFNISRFLIFIKEEEFKPRNKEVIRKDFFTLLSYEKIAKNLKVTALKRGYYKSENLAISSGDLFNIYKFIDNRSLDLSIIVYPRLITTPELKVFLNKLTGEILTKRHMIDDPFTFRGIRQYSTNDSLKLVNWNATARSGEMKVNQYDFTSSQEVLILLNTEGFNAWDSDLLIEESIRLAASISAEGIEKGIPVGIISNDIKIEPKNGRVHLTTCLEALARINSKKITLKMKDIIEVERSRAKRTYTIILISYYYDEDLFEEFNLTYSSGVNIQWILPKIKGESIKLQQSDKLFIWEVSEDERRIY